MTDKTLSAEERIERAEREVIRLTGSGPGGQRDRNFRMTVPAEPDRDSDLVLMDGLQAGREALAAREKPSALDGEGTERPHNHTIDGHHWHDCPGCDDGTPQHEATLRTALDNLATHHDRRPPSSPREARSD
jgi:hypothetical protein